MQGNKLEENGINFYGGILSHLIFADINVLIAGNKEEASEMLEKLYFSPQKAGFQIKVLLK